MAKILLEADRIEKAYGDRTVLCIDRLRIYEGEKIALIGENGAGKSTLLAILAGEAKPDSGHVKRYGPVSFIRQSGDARLSAAGRAAREMNAPDERDGLSGGEMTRRRIAGALSQDAALLLADEPTTDLDASGAAKLSQLLASHRGALVLVSHDRSLIDRLCTRVLHLEDGKIADFPGNYAEYRAELERRRAFAQFEYDRYRSEQARLKALAQQKAEWASSVKKAPKRMGNSEARLHTREYTNAVLRQSAAKRAVQDRLERLEKKERPRDLPDIRMALGASEGVRAKNALTARCETLEAGGRILVRDCDIALPTLSKSALVGDNGCGKTTLLRALRGEPSPGTRFKGAIRVNPLARIGWFDQDHALTLDMDETALGNAMKGVACGESAARTVLARLGLRGDAVFKRARVLSGGERAKTALAKLLLSDANVLFLDEPTNHLDLFATEALEELLRGYGGTLLFVSHDRAFVSAVADRILAMENGTVASFEGTLAQKEEAASLAGRARDREIEASSVRMRMAFLSSRISSPGKGDDPQALEKEYALLAEKLRQIERGGAREKE